MTYAEVMDKSDNEEDDDIEEFVQEIAESPPEPSYSTPTVTATPIQQPVYDKKSEQKGAGRMVTERYEIQYGDQQNML